MGQFKPHNNVKLVVAMISNGVVPLKTVQPDLEAFWGALDWLSAPISFDFTDYYTPEMGAPLFRQFLSFARLMDPGDLASVKIRTNKIEEKYGQPIESGIKRHINLDAGYLTLSSFVLASTKDFAHRIYIGQNIYAEIELLYRHKRFETVPWTYRDYQTEPYQAALEHIRSLYKLQLSQNGLENVI